MAPNIQPIRKISDASASTNTVLPLASKATVKRRHIWLMASFVMWVLGPLVAATIYLFTVAQDQYASYVGFAVRTEETSSAIELLGGLTEFAGSSSSDTDILFRFIKSREMVRNVNVSLDLERIFQNPDDPIFGLRPAASSEVIERYWRRMVKVFYDRNTGLMELRVNAFHPQDAQRVAQAIVNESTQLINEMSSIARTDTTRHAREELALSVERLKRARKAMMQFRSRTQIVDPRADAAGRTELLNNLQAQLANALIELDLLRQSAHPTSSRITQEERRVAVIKDRIAEEREALGSASDPEQDAYSKLVGEYEALAVDQEFAEKSYLSAQANYDSALSEAQRQSRYLATYIPPTLAEDAEYPRRFILCLLLAGGLFFSWAIATLIYYSIRDRR
ncbi:sugar transporter [Cognatishimia sp. 1_MG-2023]|uniref:sugar transporter n=1 Tax=Cognatishimia sp. 1_MG-2023 TaxID=3062642 RepID=UPI0026E39923|nr:sugar transporter [Cognatishimia sp. 1_MG-2023]MDO6728088.1 sugar transporter [Cognatishimia sp. 1_MG-2023]